MCAPAVLAGLKMVGTLFAVSAQNKALGAQAESVASATLANQREELAQIRLRQTEEAQATALKKTQRMRQGVKERSTLRARQAESGLSGVSAVRDMVASYIREGEDIGVAEGNLEMTNRNLAQAQRTSLSKAEAGLAEARGLAGRRTGGFPLALQLIGAGVEGYSQGKMLQSPTEVDTTKDTPKKTKRLYTVDLP